ncbi:MAG: dTDP-4-dehydrorhamnose reductase [Microthrixaceae bacterium]
MRILLTGARGQLGTDIAARLPEADEVAQVDLPEFDLTDRDTALGVVTQFQPDVIYHCAAFTAVDRCEAEAEAAWRANALATRFVADGARRVGAHVVYVSTDYVFDGTNAEPYLEWDTPNPKSVYGRSKLAGELEIDPAWSVARTSWVCGEHGHNMVKTLLGLGEGSGALAFVDDQIGHPTFTSDLAPMVIKLGRERVPGTFHCTNQGAVSWYEFARTVFRLAGFDAERIGPITTDQLDPPRPAPRPANSVLENFAWRHHGFAESRHYSEPLAELLAKLTAG